MKGDAKLLTGGSCGGLSWIIIWVIKGMLGVPDSGSCTRMPKAEDEPRKSGK